MDRKEIVNSEDYKAQGIALDWLRRNGYDIRDGVVDIIDAYADGVIYGWNHPKWKSIEDELPKVDGRYIIADKYDGVEQMNFDAESKSWWLRGKGEMGDFVTHWMPMPQPPRKEADND